VFPDFDEKDMDGQPFVDRRHRGKICCSTSGPRGADRGVAELPNVVAATKNITRTIRHHRHLARPARRPAEAHHFTKSQRDAWRSSTTGNTGATNSRATTYQQHPATFLLDGEGRVLASNLRGAALDAELEKQLAGKVTPAQRRGSKRPAQAHEADPIRRAAPSPGSDRNRAGRVSKKSNVAPPPIVPAKLDELADDTAIVASAYAPNPPTICWRAKPLTNQRES